MENILDPQLRKELEKFVVYKKTNSGFSQRAVAAVLGISESALSSLLSDKYTGSIKKMSALINNCLQREREKVYSTNRDLPIIKTKTSQKIFRIARHCHLRQKIGVAIGDSGFGKTIAVKEYAKKYIDTILIEADKGYSARILFRELLRAVNIEMFAHLHDMFEEFVAKVRGTGKLIIIDEAEHLPYKALELARRIYDKAEVGILFVGMPVLLNNMAGKRQQYKQLYNRVGIRCKIDRLSLDEIEEIIHLMYPSNNGIYKDFYDETEGNARTLSLLCDLVDSSVEYTKNKIVNKKSIKKLSKLMKSY